MIEDLQQDLAPKFAAHEDAIYLDAALFARVERCMRGRAAAGLDAEAVRLVEVYYKRFVHAGAKLGVEEKAS